ncbi:MAG: hydrogenase 4 subunit F [Pseudomonadota bacterium]|nr:hydrogenase 4 subunit F [Pseudomonadota bacterium]
MTALVFTLAIPAAGAAVLAVTGDRAFAALLNVAVSAATLLASVVLALQVLDAGWFLTPGRMLYVDAFNVYLVVLTAFVGMTTAVFSRPYMAHERERGRVGPRAMRLYHSMYQAFLFTMLLALTTNNLGVLWVALEAATLATVLLVSLYRTPEAVEAAWKYFILCGVGIAQALFGTVLLYFAQERLVGVAHETALSWHDMHQAASQMEPTVLVLAFVFLLVGYGTKVGLVPLHNWLPDAHSEGPTPMSAVLSGLLLNVALYAVVRVKMIVDGSLAIHAARYDPQLAGHLLMGFGLLSFTVAGLFLHRQRDIKRLYSYSSIEHMGLMTFAFGIGGPLATFGALLHMTVHSLTKSAIFVTVGHAAQIAGTQAIDNIRGLIRTQPGVGWTLLVATAAIAGFPPFGVFVSEFLLLTATMKSWPWLTLPLLIGLGVAFAGLFRHLQPMVFGEPTGNMVAVRASLWPVVLHIALVLALGLAIPGFLAGWFNTATRLIAGEGVL